MSKSKERPILFSGEMVRAILEGRKIQTRRVVKLDLANDFDPPRSQADVDAGYPFFQDKYGDHHKAVDHCPYGKAGDRLWVRETWNLFATDNGKWHHYGPVPKTPESLPENVWAGYKATEKDEKIKWKPSIHMPRWASRINLEITGVRVEQVQDISDNDALKEGVDTTNSSIPTYPKQRFEKLWNSINADRGFGWDMNPWVWCLTFKRVD